MAQRATVPDLADKAGVSVSTIDRIMNGRHKVRAGTAERVLAAADLGPGDHRHGHRAAEKAGQLR